ncbi:hypothetical protein DIPPA_07097 [Diplonema papillatum]|nr:hypothetical protein DIPPA_07097 [Diplonema papillatum]
MAASENSRTVGELEKEIGRLRDENEELRGQQILNKRKIGDLARDRDRLFDEVAALRAEKKAAESTPRKRPHPDSAYATPEAKGPRGREGDDYTEDEEVIRGNSFSEFYGALRDGSHSLTRGRPGTQSFCSQGSFAGDEPHVVLSADDAAAWRRAGKPAKKCAVVGGRTVLVFFDGTAFHCIDGICHHQGQALVDGDIEDGPLVKCPMHGRRFRPTGEEVDRGGAVVQEHAQRPHLITEDPSGSLSITLAALALPVAYQSDSYQEQPDLPVTPFGSQRSQHLTPPSSAGQSARFAETNSFTKSAETPPNGFPKSRTPSILTTK